MSITPFTSASGGFTNITNFPDIPPNSAAMRAQMEVPSAELAAYINSILIPGIADISGWTPSLATFSYTSADTPTFVMASSIDVSANFYPSVKVNMTQDAVIKYFIVTAVSGTAITLHGGTNYTLTSSPITNVSFSNAKSPFGFPLDKTKWWVISKIVTDLQQTSPVQYQWYSFALFVIPIGAWRVYHDSFMSPYRTANVDLRQRVTLSTANNSETDKDFSAVIQSDNVMNLQGSVHREKNLLLAAKTNYYLNSLTSTAGIGGIRMMHNTFGTETIICAECAYL
jgi:hypothetical protein